MKKYQYNNKLPTNTNCLDILLVKIISDRVSVSRAYSGDSFMFRFPNASRKASFFLLCSDAQSVKWAEEVRENVKAEAKNEWRELPNDSIRHLKPFNRLK